MSAPRTALDYIFALGVVGFLIWLLHGIVIQFQGVSETGNVYTLANYIWYGTPVIFLIMGTFWFMRKLKEWEYTR